MSESPELSELLFRWGELCERGSDATPEELCADTPELIQAVRERIDHIRRMERFLDIGDQVAEQPDREKTGSWQDESDTPGSEYTPLAPREDSSQKSENMVTGQLTEREEYTADPDASPPTVPGCVLKGGTENVKFGGMGVVYFGVELALGRSVAVKVLRLRLAHSAEMVSRFEAEARVNAQLQHPGIVPVHQVGKLVDGRPFYTMKRVRGETFADVLKRRPSPLSDLMGVLAQFRLVCEAMAYAHAHNVLHRDLKPNNVMVGDYGEVLLMDWGLAKVLSDESAAAEATREPACAIDLGESSADREKTRGALGTLPFMPPEQAGARIEEIDKRSDVFGLGAILCTILTRHPPYSGTNAVVVEKALRGDLEEAYLRLAESGADAELVALARKCLSPLREDRPGDGGEVAKAVLGYLAGVEERRRQAELDRVKAEAEAETVKAKAESEAAKARAETVQAEAEAREQQKRRRAQLAWSMTIGMLVLVGGSFSWWYDKQATKRQSEEASRVSRNLEALADLVGKCEKALGTGDVDRAEASLAEAKRRSSEGGGEEMDARLGRCRNNVDLLNKLNAIDTFRWTPKVLTVVDKGQEFGFSDKRIGKLPDAKAVAYQWSVACEIFGLVSADLSAEDSAARVSESLVKDRLLAVLDLWLEFDPSEKVRSILRLADPNEYREWVRDAILSGKKFDVAERIGQKEALKQPAWYSAVLGQMSSVSEVRRRELLETALRKRPGDLTLLMSLGNSYPITQAELGIENREGAENRVRWFQAAVAAHPGIAVAHNNLGNALSDNGDLKGAISEYNAAIAINSSDASFHTNLGIALETKGDLASALKEYKIAITLDSNDAIYHYNLGSVLYHKMEMEGAIREFQDAITLDPNFFAAHLNLAVALNSKRDLEGAIRECRAAMAIKPKEARTYLYLCGFLAAHGKWFASLQVLRDGIKVEPTFIDSITYRYDFACCACMVASGKTKDAPVEVDRTGLRREAFVLLTAEVTARRKLAADPKKIPALHKFAKHWLEDTDLDSVRDVENLPADERAAWAKLWADVRKLRDETAPPEIAPMPRLVK